MKSIFRVRMGLLLLLAAWAVAADEPKPVNNAAGVEFFEKRVRPLLAENCYQCHGPNKQRGGLVLDSLEKILKGGDRGAVIIPGKPDESLLIRAIRYTDDSLRMPPRGKLKDEQIDDLTTWIKMGAPGPVEATHSVAAASANRDFNLKERSRHWAYQPIRTAGLPAVKDLAWCRSPIDYFILNRLEGEGLAPASPADKRTLIRRATFDLIGLPPTLDEVESFLKDDSPDAFERVVDRLLASPHYGERWARHWLDLVRYAETLAFEFDYDLHNAWRYRDYVIRAWNDDLPYDRFVVEHLAGDVVPDPRWIDGFNESILATGFLWMGEGKQTPVDIRQEQADRIDNQIDVIGKTFLAQTIACARCHDHKFDAISTRDYYALAGYLKSSRYQQAFIDLPQRSESRVAELVKLKAQIRERIISKWVPMWLDEMARVDRYLLADLRLRRSNRQGPANSQDIAKAFGLDGKRLELWTKALQEKDVGSSDHPLHAWLQLVEQDPVGVGEGDTESFARSRDALAATLLEQTEKAERAANSIQVFEDFRGESYRGWHLTGRAFAAAPTATGDIMLDNNPQRPIAQVTSRGWHSGLLSKRLQGELRSPSFTVDKLFAHFRVSGRDARVNLVIDGNTLIMNPIYGKLTATVKGEHPVWYTMPVDRWIGHRAYIEVSDSSIPMHGLNPPPSKARVPEGPADGYVGLEQVIFSDDPQPPAEPNRLNLESLERARGSDFESLAAAYRDVIVDAIQRWRSGGMALEPSGADGIALLNWLLKNELLVGDSEPMPAAAVQGTGTETDGTARLLAKYFEAEALISAPQRAPAAADGTGEDEFVFLRGNHQTLGERIARRPPEVLARLEHGGQSQGSGRWELACELVSPSNPLITRVMANRLWHYHFGQGIVTTADDFGRMGQPPSHSELLDYLSSEFVRRGWALKPMHRMLVLSNTYRMASVPASEYARLDPENRLLHHMPVRRLEAEAIRDAMLALSGRLNSALHGPSVLPYLTPHMEGRGRPSPGPLDGEGRRSIYLNARRNFLTPLLLAFDYPVSFSTIGRRGNSTVPAQALTLMNDPFVIQQANVWAERSIAESTGQPAQRIDWLYRSAFARPPTAEETRDALAFVEQEVERHGGGPDFQQTWVDLCHVLLNVKEFIFID